MRIGDKIINIRKEHNLSQEEFAESINVSRQTVSNWENNKCYPDIETLIIISKKYNISLDDLLKNDIDMVKTIDHKVRFNKVLKISLLIIIILSTIIFIITNNKYHDKIEATKKEYIQVKENNTLLSIDKDKISNIKEINNNMTVNIYLDESDLFDDNMVPIVKEADIKKINKDNIVLQVTDEEYYIIEKSIYEGYNFIIKSTK